MARAWVASSAETRDTCSTTSHPVFHTHTHTHPLCHGHRNRLNPVPGNPNSVSSQCQYQCRMVSSDVQLLCIWWSDVTVICGHSTISMLWGNTAYCVKLSGEDVWHYSNKIESVALIKCQYYYYFTKNLMLQWQTFLTACPTSWRTNMRHRYGMKKLRQCHPMYILRHPRDFGNDNESAECQWQTCISIQYITATFCTHDIQTYLTFCENSENE